MSETAPLTSSGDIEPIEFESQVSAEGYRRVLMRVALLRLRWVLPFVAFFGFAALGRGDYGVAGLWVAIGAGVLLVVVAYARWVTGSPLASKVALARVRYSADSEGLRYESEAGAGRISWTQVSHVQHVAEHYLLYVGMATYLLVPEKDLDDAESRTRFEALIQECVPRGKWWQGRA